MRNLSRMTAVLACVAVLLLALPANAAPPPRAHAVAQASTAQAVAAWLGSLWTDLTRLFAPGISQPGGSGDENPTQLIDEALAQDAVIGDHVWQSQIGTERLTNERN